METIITEALEPKQIAEKLIPKHHNDLERAKILFLFTSQKMRHHDRVRLGSAKKTSALLRYLSSGQSKTVDKGADFILLFPEPEWKNLNDKQREALVDHELEHCYEKTHTTKKGVRRAYALRGHDLEDFTAILSRHGLWTHDHVRMAQAMAEAKQIELPFHSPKVSVVEGGKKNGHGKAKKNGNGKKVRAS